MMIEALRAELAKMLCVDVDRISPELSLDQCQWDSISAVQFITTVDLLFDVRVDTSRLEGCRTIADLLALLPDQP